VARRKSARTTRLNEPTKLQDNTGLDARLATTIIGELITPIEERVTILEGSLPDAAVQIGDVQTADVELRAGVHGGTLYVEPAGGYDETTIGRPIIIQQAAMGDSDEGCIVQFTGEVINDRQMRVRWFCAAAAPARSRVVYLIG